MRNNNYKVSFGYAITDGHFGYLEPKDMKYNDIDYMLKILDPLKSVNWLNLIGSLRRHSHFLIQLDGNCEVGTFRKFLKIERK